MGKRDGKRTRGSAELGSAGTASLHVWLVSRLAEDEFWVHWVQTRVRGPSATESRGSVSLGTAHQWSTAPRPRRETWDLDRCRLEM